MNFDLHVHTNHSDGLFSPEDVVDLAFSKNLQGIAITDHDSISAIEIAINHSKRYTNFIVIPGIEISCVHKNEEVHILGYFINYNCNKIITLTETLRKSRVSRGIRMIEKINDLGLSLSVNDVLEISGDDYIGRPHIARAMIKKSYVTSIKEAFDKYLSIGKPAYVERYKITIEETIKLIKDIDGISVLAHPGILKDTSIINHCINLGIDGIECVQSKHSKSDERMMLDIAKRNNLIATGGSDFHGDQINEKALLGHYYVDITTIPEMLERM